MRCQTLGLLVLSDRLIELILLVEHQAEVCVRFPVLWLQLKSAAIVLDRAGKVPLVALSAGHVVVHLGIIR